MKEDLTIRKLQQCIKNIDHKNKSVDRFTRVYIPKRKVKL